MAQKGGLSNEPGETIREYRSTRLTVLHDVALCDAVGECERAVGQLFVNGRSPWCEPNTAAPGVSVEDATANLAQVLSRCPTGALCARDNLGEPLLEAPGPNQIAVANDGPLYVRGELALVDARQNAAGLSRRMALCRCGYTKNGPHCDGSHRKHGFRDSGAVGNAGPGNADQFSGPLEIKPMVDGPLIIRGKFAIIAGTGRVAWRGKSTALCRCGLSKNKPFCDGSHSANCKPESPGS